MDLLYALHETNFKGASRATLYTCAQACESKAGLRREARTRGEGRNALRLRTMPSPITYMSSYIACPPLAAAKPSRLFLCQFSLVTCFTDLTYLF